MSARFELHGVFLSGPTYKVALTLALLSQPFDYVHVDLPGRAHKELSYMARQRYGQVPLLVDRSNGRHLCQSAAILEYLADMLGRFGGATLDERLQVREWLYWEFELLTPVFRARAMRLGFYPGKPDVIEHYVAGAAAALAVLDDHLAGRNWVVGEGPTIADIDLYGAASYAPEAGIALEPYPHLLKWMARVQGLPGFAPASTLLPRPTGAAA
ncbi:glutathione S-transferase family protein [Microvirga pudoricolor]|uniref:glutathione S-transferase family protein n=1 Tax=Microvirga pudoricolor TaxID=2778729 RepID=UPI00194E926B|nr:glutathione S-transferase family protein [Microvirga pudoricolor]MBM6596085.1 glutathione S-transferase family protein [Microvirga pudoricolor]